MYQIAKNQKIQNWEIGPQKPKGKRPNKGRKGGL